jgi:hypothetical protein
MNKIHIQAPFGAKPPLVFCKYFDAKLAVEVSA